MNTDERGRALQAGRAHPADRGGVFQVYGELGYDFLESVYRTAMTIALRKAGLRIEPEVELHAIAIGLILTFGPAPKVRRLVLTIDRKLGSMPRTR
jgi:hypothetical protein